MPDLESDSVQLRVIIVWTWSSMDLLIYFKCLELKKNHTRRELSSPVCSACQILWWIHILKVRSSPKSCHHTVVSCTKHLLSGIKYAHRFSCKASWENWYVFFFIMYRLYHNPQKQVQHIILYHLFHLPNSLVKVKNSNKQTAWLLFKHFSFWLFFLSLRTSSHKNKNVSLFTHLYDFFHKRRYFEEWL